MGKKRNVRQFQQIVRATRFELVDRKGRVLGELQADDDESPTLRLHDPDRFGTLMLTIMPGGFPELRFFCRGKTVAVLSTCLGRAILSLADERGELIDVTKIE